MYPPGLFSKLQASGKISKQINFDIESDSAAQRHFPVKLMTLLQNESILNFLYNFIVVYVVSVNRMLLIGMLMVFIFFYYLL
jgi:hypothetical protein